MPPMPAALFPALSPTAINLRRLLLVRAITLAVLLLTLGFALWRLNMQLPLRQLLATLSGMALLSLVTLWRLSRPWPVRDAELFVQLLLDVAALTVLLYFSGGPTNPFVTLYLLPLAITASALPGARVWWMAGVTVLCYTALLGWHVPLSSETLAHDSGFGVHVLGMWLGFVLSATLIAGFAVRMNATLRERERALAALREQALRQERVVALGTLAAGAAHELGTPLSTMAVLVKDIEPERGLSHETVAILRAQIVRCKEILASLSVAAGPVRAEAGDRRPLDVWLEDIVERWLSTRPGVVVQRRFAGEHPAPRVVAERTLAQAITNILNNAADASPAHVEIVGRWTNDALTLEIADRGPGLTQSAGESLAADGTAVPTPGRGWPDYGFTTKTEGLGLGLYLAYTVLTRFGGEVRLIDREGGGVLCRLILPLAALKLDA